MRGYAVPALLALVMTASAPYARGTEGFGLGVIVGNPTGLSFKVWTGGSSAFDAAAAWSLDDG